MPNITLSPGPASVRTYSGTLPSPWPGTGRCSLLAGQPTWPYQDPSVIPMTLAAALPNTAWSQPEAGQHQDSGQVWTPQKLAPRCKGAIYSFCPFPSFPEHVSLMSLSISCLLLCACSPLCCFPSMPAFPQVPPAHASRQADSPTHGGFGAR